MKKEPGLIFKKLRLLIATIASFSLISVLGGCGGTEDIGVILSIIDGIYNGSENEDTETSDVEINTTTLDEYVTKGIIKEADFSGSKYYNSDDIASLELDESLCTYSDFLYANWNWASEYEKEYCPEGYVDTVEWAQSFGIDEGDIKSSGCQVGIMENGKCVRYSDEGVDFMYNGEVLYHIIFDYKLVPKYDDGIGLINKDKTECGGYVKKSDIKYVQIALMWYVSDDMSCPLEYNAE